MWIARVGQSCTVCPGMTLMAVQMRILSKSTGNSEEVLEKAINRPKYFSPQKAIEFGIIDRVSLSMHVDGCMCRCNAMSCPAVLQVLKPRPYLTSLGY